MSIVLLLAIVLLVIFIISELVILIKHGYKRENMLYLLAILSFATSMLWGVAADSNVIAIILFAFLLSLSLWFAIMGANLGNKTYNS